MAYHRLMDPALSRALEMLDAIARQPRETGPVRLGEEYLRRGLS